MLSFDQEIRTPTPNPPEYESLNKVSSTRLSNTSISKYASPPIVKSAWEEHRNQDNCCIKFCRKKYKCFLMFMLCLIVGCVTFYESLQYIDEDITKQVTSGIMKSLFLTSKNDSSFEKSNNSKPPYELYFNHSNYDNYSFADYLASKVTQNIIDLILPLSFNLNTSVLIPILNKTLLITPVSNETILY